MPSPPPTTTDPSTATGTGDPLEPTPKRSVEFSNNAPGGPDNQQTPVPGQGIDNAPSVPDTKPETVPEPLPCQEPSNIEPTSATDMKSDTAVKPVTGKDSDNALKPVPAKRSQGLLKRITSRGSNRALKPVTGKGSDKALNSVPNVGSQTDCSKCLKTAEGCPPDCPSKIMKKPSK